MRSLQRIPASYISLVLITIAFLSTFHFYINKDSSMRPGIGEGDLILTYSIYKSYNQNDLTIVKNGEKYDVRRVVALSGDRIDIKEDHLVINGFVQSESYANGRTYAYKDGITFPITLKDDEVFVMADSRENTEDSRLYGPVKLKDTKGVVLVVIRHRGL